MKCDMCDKREAAEYRSLGRLVLCKQCAEDLGMICGESNRIKGGGMRVE